MMGGMLVVEVNVREDTPFAACFDPHESDENKTCANIPVRHLCDSKPGHTCPKGMGPQIYVVCTSK